MEDKCDYLENVTRQNNLVFFGLDVNENAENFRDELTYRVMEVIHQGLNIRENIEFDNIRKSGQAVIVTFRSQQQRRDILLSARDLKDSPFRRVFIREDLTDHFQEKRRKL